MNFIIFSTCTTIENYIDMQIFQQAILELDVLCSLIFASPRQNGILLICLFTLESKSKLKFIRFMYHLYIQDS